MLAKRVKTIMVRPRESARQSLLRKKERKVRAPQGRVPDNVWAAKADGKCSRKETAVRKGGKGEKVR